MALINGNYCFNTIASYCADAGRWAIETFSFAEDDSCLLKIAKVVGAAFLTLATLILGIPTFGVSIGLGAYCLWKGYQITVIEENKPPELSPPPPPLPPQPIPPPLVPVPHLFAGRNVDLTEKKGPSTYQGVICGRGTIIDPDDKEVPILLTYTFDKGVHAFRAYLLNENNAPILIPHFGALGEIKLVHYTVKEGRYHFSHNQQDSKPLVGPYPETLEQLSYLDVSWLFGAATDKQGERYRRLGTLFMHTAIELSHRLGCEGRLVVSSVEYSAHAFYWKMGLRCQDPQMNRRFEQAFEKNPQKPDLGNPGRIVMYLPLSAIPNKQSRFLDDN